MSELRDRIAQTIYGDGDELSWARSLQIADLVMWEIRLEPIEGGVDITWVPPGFIAKILGEKDE